MKHTFTLMASALIAGSASAQEFTPPAADSTNSAPFAYTESGQRAERDALPVDEGARIIGGQEADPGEWPWQIAMLINGQPRDANAQFCGGSLLLDRWVMTAAHCIHMADQQGTYRDINPAAISILVGTNVIAEGRGDAVPVEAIFRHPGYVGTEFDNDIALIKLARAPQAPYQTINVPNAEFGDQLDQPGVTTVVTGWGLTNGGQRTANMREAEIQMLSRQQCNQVMLEERAKVASEGLSYAASAFGLKQEEAEQVWQTLVSFVREPMTPNMLCSGTFVGGIGSCNGDSGGPLVVPLTDGSYIQAGVVSWGMSNQSGTSCSETALFSAYTRVSNYVDWLNQTINANP